VFLGVVEDAAVFLAAIVAQADDEAGLRAAADAAVTARLGAGRRVPGLGHPIHKVEDPRTPRMYAIAAEAGVLGPHMRALEFVAESAAGRAGRRLPINGAGAAGAALADLGFAPEIVRGFALLARTAGVVAHLAEEMERPLGMPLFRDVDERLAEGRG
jgi:citrate synthase